MKTFESTEFSINRNIDIEGNVFEKLKGIKGSKQKDGSNGYNPVIESEGKNYYLPEEKTFHLKNFSRLLNTF